MQRTCRDVQLSRQPLVLVAFEVRWGVLPKIDDFIPALQDAFRHLDYPVERQSRIQSLMVTLTGLETRSQARWEFRTRDERHCVMLTNSSLVLLTTDYGRFEDFSSRGRAVMEAAFRITGQAELGVVQRLGLRYVDRLDSTSARDHRQYLRPGLRGLEEGVFLSNGNRLRLEHAGKTRVGERDATLAVRITQTEQPMAFPPDLGDAVAGGAGTPPPSGPVTFIDMDHAMMFPENPKPNAAELEQILYGLHDTIIEAFFEHVVTGEAIEEWR